MASITTYTGGVRRIQFFDGQKQRRSIRLGKVTQEKAEEIKAKVEALNEAAIAGHAWRPEVARWVARQDADLYEKLAAADLVPKRDTPEITLAEFVDGYIASRTDWKQTTRDLYNGVRDDLVAHFGASTVLATITPYDADDFRRRLRETKAESTTRKICSRTKTMFDAAVRKRLIPESPFADMKKLAVRAAKKFYVTREMADKVLDACVDNQWKLIFALARYGGLRCPSEILPLRWSDIDWEHDRFTVHSSKTEQHEGKETRLVPLFPEIRPHLAAVFDEAAEGAEFVITRYRKTHTNLRSQLERTIKAAGLEKWPVLFNSLRATRDTELRDQFPSHVVNAWIGHSQQIAEKHYLQVTDEHFAAASAPLESELLGESGAPTAPPQKKTAPNVVHTPFPGCNEVGKSFRGD